MIDDAHSHANGHASNGANPPGQPPKPPEQAPANPYKFDVERQKRYLEMIESGMGRCEAAKAVGISRCTSSDLMRQDPTFRQLVHEAEITRDSLRNERVETALHDAAEAGNVTAIQVWLYNRMPERWNDRRNMNALRELEALRQQLLEAQQGGATVLPALQIEYVDDWYGNSTQATEAAGASEARAAALREVQARYLRATMGEDGDRIAGSLEGPRPAPGS